VVSKTSNTLMISRYLPVGFNVTEAKRLFYYPVYCLIEESRGQHTVLPFSGLRTGTIRYGCSGFWQHTIFINVLILASRCEKFVIWNGFKLHQKRQDTIAPSPVLSTCLDTSQHVTDTLNPDGPWTVLFCLRMFTKFVTSENIMMLTNTDCKQGN